MGLSNALSRKVDCTQFDISATPCLSCLSDILLPWRKFADDLPDPDIIIGAGHGTHIPVISAALSRGGRTVILMQPSLPNACFDLCFIPEHDAPRPAKNICLTRGAINTMQPSRILDANQGTILIGGPSRYHHWNEQQLLDQIKQVVVTSDIQWTLSDSPRTPASTRLKLADLKQGNVHYQSFQDAQQGWLEDQLAISGTTWVTEDSISMIYEALTCGSAVGLLSVPIRRKGRVVTAVRGLAAKSDAIFFNDWKNGKALTPVSPPLNEADRCAQLLLEKLALI